ncbi:SpoIIE family protein phosphatase [Sphaerisporangium rubeum]|uniref:histidine kinase n=1 Tax=Sphaerisporangium rubeum TaxID=321317 RepID=A0A7X0IFC6_9ACTN|nr:SpoIIE family protein phosphatase [Sphaerisporangium rubeum]MBB6473918.1 PAS domain S-box-containing protein [Sphaerisporangium rubeum]
MTRHDEAERGPAADGAKVFTVDDEIGRDLALVDWHATALGPPGEWPQSLRTAVSILLPSRFSMWMAYGPELTFFCNAAYRRDTLGHKYPWALGRPANEVWAEIWDDIGPRIDAVLATGEATWDEALLLYLERSGYPEETYHTFSYSPLRDDDGAVVGMLCVVSEETERVIGERRMATLRDLGSDPSVVRTEKEMLAFTGRQLGRNQRDLPFTLTYLFDDDGGARLAAATGITAGHPAAPPTLASGDPGAVWPAAELARGESMVVPLDGGPFTGLPHGDWPDPPTHALVVPLPRQGGAPYGFLVAALNRYRALDDGYRGFVELAAGHVATGIASARSYQAQQRRAEELAELDRAKTVFFSNISHEFRTPLSLIMGPVQELRAALADAPPQVREDLDVVHRNGLRLGKLVNTLLDFSRLEAGRMQARYEPVDLAAVTAELASVFRSAIDKAGLTFTVDCPPLAEPVYIDRDMWEKVVLNLLSNALKFTFEGSIGVVVRASATGAVVTVTDTGIGVPADEVPRLFERFHRIESARSRSNEGSGIGLALVQELVALHGGTITATSVEGQGTTFTIRLPFGTAHLQDGSLVPPKAPEAVSATASPFLEEAMRWLPDGGAPADETAMSATGHSPAPGDGTPPRVLIADDNADMREYLTRLLKGAGYRVDAVGDGMDALDAVRAEAPALVVSDVMMPRLDGLALVSALRSDPRTADVPVLLLSARAGQEASIEGLEAGADDYLVKPFTAAELLARVRANVELARMRSHHIRWRNAMIDSLQEAFFVVDENGAVVEINSAFTDILGYGPENLPYAAQHPWWPDAADDPQAHAAVAEAFARLIGEGRGNCVIPLNHRDGHQVWIAATFSDVTDPDSGRRHVVGTLRDVTAERHLVQRESALAALSMRLSQADDLADAVRGALETFQEVWQARRVAGVVWSGDTPAEPVTAPAGAGWPDLQQHVRERLAALREEPPLRPLAPVAGGAGICLDHPDGLLALWIDLGQNRPFTGEDQTLLALLAGHLGQGLHRVHQLDQQREAAVALQRAILGPSRLPDGFAVRYEPASRPLEVGGDWYDIVPLAGERIGIVVGDCVGRGLPAAAVMGQLRSACRALLLQDAGPAQVFAALDRFAALVPGARCTTVFCGVLDGATGELVYSSAGHPPGILAHADGTTELLEGGRSTPLAVRPGHPRPEATAIMPARSTLLLYTDGLVERRRRPLTAGIDQAGAAVQAGRTIPIEDLAADIMTRLIPEDGFNDDVALLLYRQPGPLEMAFPAESSQLAPVRAALRDWLARCKLTPSLVQNVLVAAGEACANAIEHGHRNAPGSTIRLRAVVTVDDLRLTVADTGHWKPPQPEASRHRGRGVALMRALMNEVTINPGAAGTTVDMHARITP